MSTKKHNIAQIRKYLNGELNARAMFELERDAHNDPLLWDMIKGIEGDYPGHQANLQAINNMIAERVQQDRGRIVPLWQRASIAASLLIALGVGGWLFMHQDKKEVVIAKQTPAAIIPDRAKVKTTDTTLLGLKDKNAPLLAKLKPRETVRSVGTPAHEPSEKLAPIRELAGVSVKADTVEYKASAYPVRAKASVDEILKKLPGVDVDANGNLTAQGQQVAKARINGKDFTAGDMKTAIKSLPADIVDKIHVIDDYGDQATKTGVKTGDPDKVLNIIAKNVVDKSRSEPLNALYNKSVKIVADSNNKPELKEVALAMAKKDVKAKKNTDSTRVLSKTLMGKVEGVNVTTSDAASRNYTQMITGRVVDRDTREPLPGVSVKVTGSNQASQTDVNGKFKIVVPGGKETLDITYIGYNTQRVKTTNKDSLNVKLSPSSQSLSEVIVTGYGTPVERVFEDAHPAIGWKAYNKYLKENTAAADGKTGTVKLSFEVDKNGAISNIQVMNSLGQYLDNKAIQLLKTGPAWVGRSDAETAHVKLKISFYK